jgi:hypothetical protein
MYRDPAEQLLDAEAETCKGCMFRKTGSDGVARCANPGMRTVLAEERCDEYEELQ